MLVDHEIVNFLKRYNVRIRIMLPSEVLFLAPVIIRLSQRCPFQQLCFCHDCGRERQKASECHRGKKAHQKGGEGDAAKVLSVPNYHAGRPFSSTTSAITLQTTSELLKCEVMLKQKLYG